MSEPTPMLTEHDDRWLLPLRGRTVTGVRVESALRLSVAEMCEVVIEGEATLGWADSGVRSDRVRLDPGCHDAALELLNTTVLSAVVFKSGGLRIVFSSGRVLQAGPDPAHESWTVAGPGDILIVSLAGGALSIWAQT